MIVLMRTHKHTINELADWLWAITCCCTHIQGHTHTATFMHTHTNTHIHIRLLSQPCVYICYDWHIYMAIWGTYYFAMQNMHVQYWIMFNNIVRLANWYQMPCFHHFLCTNDIYQLSHANVPWMDIYPLQCYAILNTLYSTCHMSHQHIFQLYTMHMPTWVWDSDFH